MAVICCKGETSSGTITLGRDIPVFSLKEPYGQIGTLQRGAEVELCGEINPAMQRVRFSLGENEKGEAQCKTIDIIPGLNGVHDAKKYHAAKVQVAFCPGYSALNSVLSMLRQARRRVDVAMFYLREDKIIETLCYLSARKNVDVRVIVNSHMNSESARPLMERLASCGVKVHVANKEHGKMHLKTAVVDERVVITGCANWTAEAFKSNFEDTFIIESPQLAHTYITRFNELIGASVETIKDPAYGRSTNGQDVSLSKEESGNRTFKADVDDSRTFANVSLENLILPATGTVEKIRCKLLSARKRIDIGMYLLSSPEMIDTLCWIAENGQCEVRVLVDQAMLRDRYLMDLQRLLESGVEVLTYTANRSILHLKTAIIDERYLIAGSANWTTSGLGRNAENIVIFDCPRMAEYYTAYLDTVQQHCRPFKDKTQQDIDVEDLEEQETTIEGYIRGLPPTGPRESYDDIRHCAASTSFYANAWVDYISDEEYLPVLLKLIDSAQQSIVAMKYAIPKQKRKAPNQELVMEHLIKAAKRGVYVMVLLEMPHSGLDRLNRHHGYWAERLRAEGIDVRFGLPKTVIHVKSVIVDNCKALIGSNNWSEGALSSKRVYESSALLVLEKQDMRFAEYVMSRKKVSDMRSRPLWEQEIQRLRTLFGADSGEREMLVETYLETEEQ